MPTLLIVHHTASPALHSMFEAVMSGATDERIEDVVVLARAALAATAVDVLAADGYLLGTPANLGYMSGALKHFFDQIYYPCLQAGAGRPYGLYIHGNNDTTGALRAIEAITTGLQWRRAQAPVLVTGQPDTRQLEACWELGAALAAGLSLSYQQEN
jgi:multimeric flavodoxin WrbA